MQIPMLVSNIQEYQEDKYQFMLKCRKNWENYAANNGNDLKARFFTNEFNPLERYGSIVPWTLQILMYAMVAVFVVSLIFMGPLYGIFTCVIIAFVNMSIMGMLTLMDINLNVIIIINLVLAVGFSIDYVAHIIIAWDASKHSDPEKRLISVLTHMGGSVMHGGISTSFAVFCLIFTLNRAYQILQRTFTGMVGFGLLHGLVFAPAFLAQDAGMEMRRLLWGKAAKAKIRMTN